MTIVKFRKGVITNRVTDTCSSDSWSSPTSLLKMESVRVSETLEFNANSKRLFSEGILVSGTYMCVRIIRLFSLYLF